jgi:hypothetical protein
VAQALAGDNVVVNGLPSAQFSSKNVGLNLPVSVANFTLSGQDADNYTATGLTGITATISPAPLTATASAFTKVYDATTSATPSLTISGLISNETLGVTGTGSLNSKNVLEANTLTVGSVALSDGSNGGLASNYVLGAGQTAPASITPATLSATGIAASKSIYGSPVVPGSAEISGVIGRDDVIVGVTLHKVSRSSSNHVNAGSYQQAVTTLSGQDASNYKLTPFTTTDANYVVAPLMLSGSIESRSTNAGAVLTPGVATLNNVIPTDSVSISEVVVVIPGAAPGSKTGNVVGSFVGSQKIASLNGADAANYDFSKVVGDYLVKTGFSSGTVYPREMTSSWARAEAVTQSFAELPVTAQTSKVATAQVSAQMPRENLEATKNDAPSVGSKSVASVPKDRGVVSVFAANKNPIVIQSIASFNKTTPSTPFSASYSSLLGETTTFPGPSIVYSGEASQISAESDGTNQGEVMAPIYASIRELLANPTTYQVIGAASSIVYMVKTLVMPAMTSALSTAPNHAPSRAPVKAPTQPSSFLNNASNTRLSRRA